MYKGACAIVPRVFSGLSDRRWRRRPTLPDQRTYTGTAEAFAVSFRAWRTAYDVKCSWLDNVQVADTDLFYLRSVVSAREAESRRFRFFGEITIGFP